MSRSGSDVIEKLRAVNPVEASDLEEWVKDAEAQQILARIIASRPGPKHRDATIPKSARLALLGGMSILAAVALVLGLLPGDADNLGPATAAEVLRQAARSTADQPHDPAPGPGQFAYIRRKAAYQYGMGDGWAVLAANTRETWVSPRGSGRFVQEADEVTFFGPRDRARCEEQLGVRQCETLPRRLADEETYRYSSDEGFASTTFGDKSLTYEELKGLPTDPNELEPMMRKIAADAANPDYQVFVMVGDMLRQPLTPRDLRVALYEVAARIEGVELIGEVTDPVGRSGTAVALTSAGHVTPLPEPGEGDIRSEIIFDPDTGRFLAERDVLVNRVDYLDANPGTVIGWAAYLESAVVNSVTQRPD